MRDPAMCTDCGIPISRRATRCAPCNREVPHGGGIGGGPVTPEQRTQKRAKALQYHATVSGRAETSPEFVATLRTAQREGLSYRAMAEKFHVGIATVSILIRYGSWGAYYAVRGGR